jgi:hypothetical protein
MLTLKRTTLFTLCSAILLSGCSKTETAATDTAAAEPAPAGLTAADVTGRWDMRAVPVSGDTTATTFVLTAGADNTGWTLTYPNRPPVPTRVTIAGDSIVSESEPYESVRRKGVQVRTHTVLRLEGENLVGTAVARYSTKGADSVLNLRVTGTRAK